MLRFIIVSLVLTILLRLISSTYAAFMDGLHGTRGRHRDVPRPSARDQQAVHMARDPVCGTFVVPERAVSIADGHSRVYFCSEKCRDTYRARPSTGSGRPEHVEGRTA